MNSQNQNNDTKASETFFATAVIIAVGVAMFIPWLFILIPIGISIYIWAGRTAPERAARRAIMEEKKRKDAEEQLRQKERFAELMRQQEESKIAQYRHLRKEIEAMPQYAHWRQSVIEKLGRKCSVCGSTEDLEVDHRYKSFYAILREYGIENTVQAYECKELWDVNNGAPLCKAHHDQTGSSVYRQQKLA